MQEYNPNAAWRDVGKATKVGPLSSYLIYPFVVFLLYMNYLTLGLVVITGIFFFVLEYYGYKPGVFFRTVRSVLAGARRTRRMWWG